MKRGSLLFGLILTVGIISIITLIVQIDLSQTKKKNPIENVPGFSMTNSSRGRISDQDLLGRRYCLLFYRADCDYCLEELKQLNRIYPAYKENFDLFAVSLNDGKPPENVLGKLELYFASSDSLSDFGVKNVPVLLLVDERGKIVYRQPGMRSDAFQKTVFDRFVRGESLTDDALRFVFKP